MSLKKVIKDYHRRFDPTFLGFEFGEVHLVRTEPPEPCPSGLEPVPRELAAFRVAGGPGTFSAAFDALTKLAKARAAEGRPTKRRFAFELHVPNEIAFDNEGWDRESATVIETSEFPAATVGPLKRELHATAREINDVFRPRPAARETKGRPTG